MQTTEIIIIDQHFRQLSTPVTNGSEKKSERTDDFYPSRGFISSEERVALTKYVRQKGSNAPKLQITGFKSWFEPGEQGAELGLQVAAAICLALTELVPCTPLSPKRCSLYYMPWWMINPTAVALYDAHACHYLDIGALTRVDQITGYGFPVNLYLMRQDFIRFTSRYFFGDILGSPVFIKFDSVSQPLDKEAAAYFKLHSLQGYLIPRFLGLYNFNSCRLMITTYIRGNTPSSFDELSHSQK